MSVKPVSGILLILLLMGMLSLAFNFCGEAVMGEGGEWVVYIPKAGDVEFYYWKENGTSYFNVSIKFPSSGYNVSDWKTPTIIGDNISADAEIWMWTGWDYPMVITKSHSYNFGNLSPGEYDFTFKAWGQPVKNTTFTVPIIVPDDYPTIQEAVDAADLGDTIYVRAGTYGETVNIDKDGLTLVGENKANTTINQRVVVDANNATIEEFTLKGTPEAIRIWGNYNVVRSNNVSYCHHGVVISSGSNFTLVENCVMERVQRTSIRVLGDCYNTIIQNNTLVETGAVDVWSCPFTIIKNNVFTGMYPPVDGIILGPYANRSTVKNNILTNTDNGIGIYKSHEVYIYGNAITRTYKEYQAIHLYNCTQNHVYDNNLTRNTIGIKLESSNSNTIYHNTFIDNTNQVALSNAFNNTWDNGHTSGGNYWSDYNGTDLYNGPNQDIAGSDGIGDTPYIIDENNTDHYPLMKAYPWDPHDVGITNLVTSKTVVGQGFEVQINASVLNYGNSTENFNLTAYGNTTAIASKNVTLENRNSTTVIFTWNTTGYTKGNYTITVEATPVPSETNTADNTFTNGIIKVVIPGDINGDGTVDVFDAVILSGASGSTPRDEHWNPNADINSDLTVDIFDAVILSRHAGETPS